MNNVWNYYIFLILFLGVFGTISLIGGEALKNNSNLDSDSIAAITQADTELYTDFKINATTGNITAIKTSSGLSFVEGASAQDREFLNSRSDLTNSQNKTDKVTKIPSKLINSIWFVNISDTKLYLGLITALIVFGLFIAGYKFVRTGEADNR